MTSIKNCNTCNMYYESMTEIAELDFVGIQYGWEPGTELLMIDCHCKSTLCLNLEQALNTAYKEYRIEKAAA